MQQPMKTSTTQLKKSFHKHKKSSIRHFLEVLFVLVLILGSLIGCIFYYGSQEIHSNVPYALNEIFSTQEQKTLIQDLEKKGYQYTLLHGANQTGIFQFLEHYADLRSGKGNTVVIRRIQDNAYEAALRLIRITKNYIQQNINLETDLGQADWLFIVKNGQVPLVEIQNIKKTKPKDRIIVGVVKKHQIKGFKPVKYPGLQISEIQEVLAQQLGVTAKEAAILTRFYGNIPEILFHLDQISYTHQKHLGEAYENLQQLNKKQKNVLKKLCKNGEALLQGSRHSLESVGVISHLNKVYWYERINRLNYELAQQTECVDQVVPAEIKAKIERQALEKAEAEAKGEIDGEEQQNEQVPEKATKQTKAKPSSSKKSKSKPQNEKESSQVNKKSQNKKSGSSKAQQKKDSQKNSQSKIKSKAKAK